MDIRRLLVQSEAFRREKHEAAKADRPQIPSHGKKSCHQSFCWIGHYSRPVAKSRGSSSTSCRLHVPIDRLDQEAKMLINANIKHLESQEKSPKDIQYLDAMREAESAATQCAPDGEQRRRQGTRSESQNARYPAKNAHGNQSWPVQPPPQFGVHYS